MQAGDVMHDGALEPRGGSPEQQGTFFFSVLSLIVEADTIPPVAENTSLFGLFFKLFFLFLSWMSFHVLMREK